MRFRERDIAFIRKSISWYRSVVLVEIDIGKSTPEERGKHSWSYFILIYLFKGIHEKKRSSRNSLLMFL